jgi:hypothetical protein
MTIRRKPLYLGVFLVAAGAAILVAQAGGIDRSTVADALRLWPLAVVAIGAALLMRHTRAGLAGGLVAAALPGLLLGGAVSAAPNIDLDCALGSPGIPVVRDGSFAGPARVHLDLACGSVTVNVAPGNGWRVDTRSDESRTPSVTADGNRLSVVSSGHRNVLELGRGDTWQIALPGDSLMDLDTEIDAGRGRLDLAGARLGSLNVQVNAGEATADLSGATAEHIAMHVNAGAGTLVLPSTGTTTAELTVNAGRLTVCVPAGLAVRVHGNAALGSIDVNGLVRTGDRWESPGYATATSHADLTVSASVGSVDINPEGGCL